MVGSEPLNNGTPLIAWKGKMENALGGRFEALIRLDVLRWNGWLVSLAMRIETN